MRKIAALMVAGVLGVAGWSMAKEEAKAPAAPPQTQPAAAPVNKFCPLAPDHEVDPTVTTVYKGKTIGFCCEGCVPKFEKDPERYVKNLK